MDAVSFALASLPVVQVLRLPYLSLLDFRQLRLYLDTLFVLIRVWKFAQTQNHRVTSARAKVTLCCKLRIREQVDRFARGGRSGAARLARLRDVFIAVARC